MRPIALALLAALASGCLQAPAADDAPAAEDDWYFGALFAADPRGEDVERARAIVERHGGAATFVRGEGESTLLASGFGVAACEAARAEVAAAPGVRNVSECNANLHGAVEG